VSRKQNGAFVAMVAQITPDRFGRAVRRQ